jgi:hypothetical protein
MDGMLGHQSSRFPARWVNAFGIPSNAARRRIKRPNNAMQLTRGGWSRVGASSSAPLIVNQGGVVRPSQLIASVRPTEREIST